jgi:protein-S-isoprenylcysteine O-methyltransferase Ste14
LNPQSGSAAAARRHPIWAISSGVLCHISFLAAVGAMILMTHLGMSRCFGRAPAIWGIVCNGLLLAQFPLLHSLLLTKRGGRVLKGLAPRAIGADLTTTTYATIASFQTLALFLLWTPSGIIWWRAHGAVRLAIDAMNAGAWLFLLKAIIDAGLSVQTGSLGWWSVLRARPPRYPPMPTRGLFRLSRQPIYYGFALTLWTTPTWTPDQAVLAIGLGGYCVLGPLLKEARFNTRFGGAFETYRKTTPYWWPDLRRLARPKATRS